MTSPELETVAVVSFAKGSTVAEMIHGVCFGSASRVNLFESPEPLHFCAAAPGGCGSASL
eukprot:CAMPEP_0172851876 /NCGR_PEP_ID=MMETSP1075-20121228/51895_1 /TAXON_ID=2916 /ORGANISM="Ceratium fusus, Strain PA161109" /LENGTH=59 /DNA_ID=CAMNT_0013697955 /DNA_START=290 /DNA_END=466 /DNA_ORIENTATION=+